MKRLSAPFALPPCLLLLLSAFLAAGCIGDDVSGCPSVISLTVTAEITVGVNPSADNTFNQTGVYVFDASGVLVDYGRLVSEDGTNGQVVELAVKEGRYTIVTWCGADFSNDYEIVVVTASGTLTDTFAKGVTRLSDMRLRAKADRVCDTHTGNLFWNALTEVTVTGNVSQVKLDSKLQKNSNVVEVVLKGMEETPELLQKTAFSPTRTQPAKAAAASGSRYEVRLTTVAGVYKFDNTTDTSLSQSYTYLPYEAESRDGDLYLRLRTMRLFTDIPALLTVTDRQTGGVLYSADLIGLIMQNPAYRTQQDLDREDNYRIEIGGGAITPGAGTGITITVNGWEIVVLDPQL